MLYFAPWKKIMILAVCVLGLFFSMPNFFYDTVDTANKARHDIAKQIEDGQSPSEDLTAKATAWPEWAPDGIVNLGLDLQGGAHFLYEVKIEQVYAERMENLWPDVRSALRKQKDTIGRFKQDRSNPEVLGVRLLSPTDEAKSAAVKAIQTLAQPVG
jgi:preprotein translocase subunit SecD